MRTVPPEWTPELYAGDLWAAPSAAVATYSATWDDLDPDETWEDQPPAATWAQDVYAEPIGVTVIDGLLSRDWAGGAGRVTATVVLPEGSPNVDEVATGKWIILAGHLCPPSDAPPLGDPVTVPAAHLATLYIVGLEHEHAAGIVTAAAEDLVTLLGARVLDTGTGPPGYLPTARTAQGVIGELVDRFAPVVARAIADPGAPDAPWAPEVDDDGHPVPLTGSVWGAIEAVCGLAGLAAHAEGPELRLHASTMQAAHSGLTITETPALDGIQAVRALRQTAPAVTRVIVTGVDGAGTPIAGRAHDPDLAAEQGLDRDEALSVSGATDIGTLGAAAIARLEEARASRAAGTVDVPWLPMLEPGDLVTMAWATAPLRSYWIDSTTVPLDPARPVTLTLRGPLLARWQDEPPGEPWTDLDPGLTWAEDI